MDYLIREGAENMDMDAVVSLLADTYWWREDAGASARIRRAAENSGLLVGAFLPNGEQIGYARVITDFVRLAYIADVIVREDCRRQGVASAMLRHIRHAPALSDVSKFLLITGDAHALYEASGFFVSPRGGDYMEWSRKTI